MPDINEEIRENMTEIAATVKSRYTALEKRMDGLAAKFSAPRLYQDTDNDEELETFGFKNLGEFVQVAILDPSDSRLETRELSAGDGSAGGYTIPPAFVDSVLTLNPNVSIVRPRATIVPSDKGSPDAPCSMPKLKYGSDGILSGVTVKWIAEGAAKTATEPEFELLTLKAHEVAAYCTLTDRLLRNSSTIQPTVSNLFRNACRLTEENAFLNGSGVGQPLGVLQGGACVNVARAVGNQIAWADMRAMVQSFMWPEDLATACWVTSQSCLDMLLSMESTAGDIMVVPSERTGSINKLMIMGLPIFVWSAAPVLGSRGDLILADFSKYLIKNGSPLAIDASQHALFTEDKTILRVVWNVDGQPWMQAPLTLEDGATEVSPFVVLAA